MAIANEILVPRFNRALQKLFGMKGHPPVPQLAPEISATHQFFSGAEHRYLEGWGLYGTVFTLNPGAGNVEEMQIRNPKGSGIIAVVHKAGFESAVSEFFQIGIDNTGSIGDLAGPGTVVAWDPRQEKNSSCVVSFAAVAAPGALLNVFGGFLYSLNQNQLDFLIKDSDEIPLVPGAVLRITTLVGGNNTVRGNLWWRERFLEESERL